MLSTGVGFLWTNWKGADGIASVKDFNTDIENYLITIADPQLKQTLTLYAINYWSHFHFDLKK
jgi:hypothetical protein